MIPIEPKKSSLVILFILILYYFKGVATFCRHTCTPIRAEEGLAGTLPSTEFFDSVGYYGDIEQEFSLAERKELDAEGRAIITQHDIKVHLVYRRQKRKLDIQKNDLPRCLVHCLDFIIDRQRCKRTYNHQCILPSL